MKRLNLVSIVCVAVVFASPIFVHAQNYRSPYGNSVTSPNQSRSFLGLPIPQQWIGSRPATMNQYTRNGAFSTGTCRNCNCPEGACANGLCASGQCATCASGQCSSCANGQCANGQCGSGNCPNGQCRLNQYPNTRYNSGIRYGVQGDWSPRTTRSNLADPYRPAEYSNRNDSWTQRPSLRNPVKDLYPSRYNRSDLDLRRPYFNNQSGELNDTRAGEDSSTSRDVRAPRPSDRSLFGAPADRAYGLAQI